MNPSLATVPAVLGPLSPDWTIERLLEWIAEDDARLSAIALRHPLRAVEEALTGTRWTVELDRELTGTRLVREPAIVSLVRSIALHASRHPAVRAMTLAEIVRADAPVATPAAGSGR